MHLGSIYGILPLCPDLSSTSYKMAMLTNPTLSITTSGGLATMAPGHSPVNCSVELGMFSQEISVHALVATSIVTSPKDLSDLFNSCKGSNCNTVHRGSPLQIPHHCLFKALELIYEVPELYKQVWVFTPSILHGWTVYTFIAMLGNQPALVKALSKEHCSAS